MSVLKVMNENGVWEVVASGVAGGVEIDSSLTESGMAADAKAVGDAINGMIETSKIVNNFTTTTAGYVADARALKTLNDNKIETSKIVNNLTTTAENFVADARALKTLNDNKISIDNIINDFTTTDAGYVADARALKALNDNKIEMELVWEKSDTTESMAAGSLPLTSSDFSHFMIDFIGRQPSLIIRKGTRYDCSYILIGGRASGSTTNHDTTLTFYVREIDFRDTGTTNAVAVADCYYTYFLSDTNKWLAETKSNGAIVPYRIWGIRGIA